MRAVNLPTCSVRLSYESQLWSGMKYGLGAFPTSLDELMNGLGTRDHKILSKLGICKNINKPWRYLSYCYKGMQLNSLPIEATAAFFNSFLQHYNTELALEIYLTASIENMQIELGVGEVPICKIGRGVQVAANAKRE